MVRSTISAPSRTGPKAAARSTSRRPVRDTSIDRIAHLQPRVDADDLAADIRGEIGRQERHHVRNLFHAPRTADRKPRVELRPPVLAAELPLRHPLRAAAVAVRHDRPRVDADDADAVAHALAAEAL